MESVIELFKYIHYNRNILNKPVSFEDASESWDGSVRASYHQQGAGNEGNVKYISPDGHHEVIFDKSKDRVNCPLNMGTYNFKSPKDAPLGHVIEDIIPYILLGNSPDDPTSWYHRIFGTY